MAPRTEVRVTTSNPMGIAGVTETRASSNRSATLPMALLLLSTILVAGCSAAGHERAGGATSGIHEAGGSKAADNPFGIEVVALRLTASGTMVDFRYRVIDPARAKDFLKKGAQPYIVDPRTGMKLTVPSASYIGALRQTAIAPEEGKVYFILFGNSSRAVKAGNPVTLVMGDFRMEDLVVM
jgi:hypothetical protein